MVSAEPLVQAGSRGTGGSSTRRYHHEGYGHECAHTGCGDNAGGPFPSDQITDTGDTARTIRHTDGLRLDCPELGRLEQLGLVSFPTSARRVGDVRLTSAGVEMLSYLASTE
nr:hypothetical protein ISGA_649 [Gordonia sp. NB41Y]